MNTNQGQCISQSIFGQYDDGKPLLDESFLELLSKKELTVTEKQKIYEFSVRLFCNNYGNNIQNVHIEFINDPNRPISQVGFSIDFDDNNKFNHMIFANVFFLQNYPVERIILIACHECAHLEKNDRIANSLNFSKVEDIEKYKVAISRNTSEEWYLQEEEKRADSRAFFVAKNIYQRAVHDTTDLSLKKKFWSSFSLLEYNEKLEMAKHNSENEPNSSKKK